MICQYTGNSVSICLAQAYKPPLMSLNLMDSDLMWFLSFWTAICESFPLLHTTYTGKGWFPPPADLNTMWSLRLAKRSSLSIQLTGKSKMGLSLFSLTLLDFRRIQNYCIYTYDEPEIIFITLTMVFFPLILPRLWEKTHNLSDKIISYNVFKQWWFFPIHLLIKMCL